MSASYSPYAFRPPAPGPPAPVPQPPPDTRPPQPPAAIAATHEIWKTTFQPPITEKLLTECQANMLDFKIGIIDAHVFVSTNYISFLVNTQKKTPVVIQMTQIATWTRATKSPTPGVAPFIKVKTFSGKPGERADSIHLYTTDQRLHLIFDFGMPYERFLHVFDTAWRLHHPNIQQALRPSIPAGVPGSLTNPGMYPFPGAWPPPMFPGMPMASFNPGAPFQTGVAYTGGPTGTFARGAPMAMAPPFGAPPPPPPGGFNPPITAAPSPPGGVPTPQGIASPLLQRMAPSVQTWSSGNNSGSGGSAAGSPVVTLLPGQGQPYSPPSFPPPMLQQQGGAPVAPAKKLPTPDGDGRASPPGQVSPGSTGTPTIEPDASLAGFKVVESKPEETADPEAAFVNGSTTPDWKDMPIQCVPSKLTFGLGSRQAPIDHELSEVIVLSNTSGSKHSYRFCPKPSGKYKLSLDPCEGKIPTGKTLTVEIKITILCTTQLRLELPFVVWKGDPKDSEKGKRLCAMLSADIQSQLTTKLDSDELTLYSPAIGDGSFGTVFRGEFRGLEVAIKVLKFQQALTHDMLDGFKSEVEIMEKLRHPCIINFIGAVHALGHMAIVTEFCTFGNLGSAIKHNKFSYGLKLKALLDSARGMDFLHRSNILHRDLKPDNILMVSLEVRSSVVCKISDFGTTRDINRFASEMHFTKGVGTPIFMAPEMLQGKSAYAPSADVYSYGLMMANLANEKLPFEDDPEITTSFQFATLVIEGKRPQIIAQIPDEYLSLMKLCWSGIPVERPSFADIVIRVEAMFKKEVGAPQRGKP